MVSIVMLLVQFALAALLSPSMALIALVLVGGGLLASRVWLRRGSRSGREISAVHQRSAAAAFRLHAGLKAAMAQGTAPQFLREYRATLNDLSRELIVYDRDRSLAQNIASGGAALCAALLLVIGDRVLQLPFALLLTLIVLFSRMAGPALQFQQSLQGLSAHVPSFAQLRHRFGSSAAGAVAGADAAPLEWRELVLDRATYRHPGGEGGTQELSLSIASGEWVALSGPSGAGKTTAADLVAGLLRPQSGSVAVDRQPLEGETLDGWRHSLAYVGQTDTVFDDTVRGNLLAEGATADDAAMWSVLEAVGLGERIQAFPEQLDAQVGDRGSSLSGGERQRLTIARALLRNASLLILDEATNALDAAGEQSVLGHLRALQPRPAALLIAHRPGPLALCDRVVEIDKGRQAGS
jgi:ATP-binding cassette subfamily C protein